MTGHVLRSVVRLAGTVLACAVFGACSHSSHSSLSGATTSPTSTPSSISVIGTTSTFQGSNDTTVAPPATSKGPVVTVAMTSTGPTRRVTLRVGQTLVLTAHTNDLAWVADTPPRVLKVDPGSVCYATCARPRRVFHAVAPGTAELDTVLRCPSLSLCPQGPRIVVRIVP